MVEGVGFEPTKAEPADLQSAPVDRLGTPPGKWGRIIYIDKRTSSAERPYFSKIFLTTPIANRLFRINDRRYAIA